MPRLPFAAARPRLVVATAVFAVGLTGLSACGRANDDARPSREHPAHTHEPLVAAAEHYVGAQSLGPKELALTFDDGPGPRTLELSTYLKDQGIHAVFFVNGACVASTTLPNNSCATPTANAPAILAQLTADGHLVGNHTTTHRDVTTLAAAALLADLTETNEYLVDYAKTPYNRSLFRAPFGSWSAAAYDALKASAVKHYVGPIYWDIGGFDNAYPDKAADWACYQGQMKNQGGGLVHSAPGDMAPDGYLTTKECGDAYLKEIDAIGRGIVLMHDQYGWAQGHTVDMVKYLVPLLKNAGYTFVRADEVPIIAADLPACGAGCTECSGPGATQCTACAPGRFLSGGACKACSACAAGEYASTACTATADTKCTPCTTCAAGTYAAVACTATADATCAACAPGCDECTGPGADECATCPPGQHAAAGGCAECTTCAPGSFSSTACRPAADTVCSPCAAGTYSAVGGATRCEGCEPGTFTPDGGATACVPCGSCDDGDSCTEDACSQATGCTHAHIEGCITPAAAEPPAPAKSADPTTPEPAVTQPGSGCAAGGAAAGAGTAWLAALGLVGLAYRRRRTRG